MNREKEMKMEIAGNNKHIPTGEIKQDIADTEAEIITMKREIKAFKILSDRMSILKANSRKFAIHQRQKFIENLKIILKIRKEQNNENK